jgi:hypothetical protein
MQQWMLKLQPMMLLKRNPAQVHRILMAACDRFGAFFLKGCWPHLSMYYLDSLKTNQPIFSAIYNIF